MLSPSSSAMRLLSPSWSFEEKMGRPLDAIHNPRPTLMRQFAKLSEAVSRQNEAGISWETHQLGLSRTFGTESASESPASPPGCFRHLNEVWFEWSIQSCGIAANQRQFSSESG